MVKLTKKTREQYMKVIVDALEKMEKERFRDTFLKLHPSDQADAFKALSSAERDKVYLFLRPEEFSHVFENLNAQDQKVFFLEMDDDYASSVFNNLFTDDVVQFLKQINPQRADEILQKMEKDKAEKVRTILTYAEETAGAVMTKELVSIPLRANVADVLETLRESAPDAEIIYYLYVTSEEGELVGVVSLRELIIATPEMIVEDIMSANTVTVFDDMDQEEVGMIIQKYDLLAVPVVSKQNKLLGIVTVDDVMDILEAETTEDFGEIAATKGATDINMSPFQAAKKRSPWIVLLMILGLATGGVIQGFEDTLEASVLLAFFIPMIMDSGGNVGTQSLAVAVRGLALGTVSQKGFWHIVRRELLTGAMMGLLCMVVIALIVPIILGNAVLGLVVGIAIFFTLMFSAVIGAIIPLFINKMKMDPALASGPFITTLNDVVGLLIYFSIATYLMEYL